MTAPNSLINYHGLLDINTKFSTANQVGYVPSISGLIASYDFSGSDTMQTVKNGFSWQGNSDVAVPIPGKGVNGIPYIFTGSGNNLAYNTIMDRYFYFNEQNEVWFRHKFFVPTNYTHRSIEVINVSGSLSSWQVGDQVVTVDGSFPGSTGTIYGINGIEVQLQFAQNPYGITWGTSGSPVTITNTTRSQNRTSVHVENHPDNNKLFVLYCDGYSSFGINPTIVFQGRSVNGLYSEMHVNYGGDLQGTGIDNGNFSDFITVDQLGKFIDIFYGVKLASAVGVSDGSIELWIKREGESSYTRKMNVTGLPIWKRNGTPDGFKAGYVHGAQNSGFYNTTIFYDQITELYNTKPAYLV